MEGEMQCNSFFPGFYSTGDVNSEANWSFWPVKDMNTTLSNGYNMNSAFSFSYRDLYLRHFKEVLKQTMLKHESVFEDQIHELHRLYWRQKELMVEMEALHPNPGLAQSSSQHIPRKCHTTSIPWMNPCFSTSKMSISPQEDTSARIPEFSANEGKKSGKKALDLELPACEYLNVEDERVLQEGQVHEISDLQKEPSMRSITLMSDCQLDNLHHSTSMSKLKCTLDLNEPVKREETSDSELNRFLNPVAGTRGTSNEIVEESHARNNIGASENGRQGINEVQVLQLSEKGRAENGIDLNMSPEEKPTIHEKIESKQHQESLSVSLNGKHGLAQSCMVVQALPCFNGIASSSKCSKPLARSSWPSKKVKWGPKVTGVASFPKNKKVSDLDLNSGLNADDDPLLRPTSFVPEMDLQAPVSPDNKESARPSTESDNNQASTEKENSSSLADVDSVQNQTNPRNKESGQPGMESCNSHTSLEKISRENLENRGSLLATEEGKQERTAAEAIVEISTSGVQTHLENSAHVTSCESLYWFANIASSVIEDEKSEFGLSVRGCHSSNGTDYFEAMTLQLAEMKVEEHYSLPKTNIANHKTAISNFAPGRPRRGRGRRGKRQHKDFHREFLPSLASLSRNEVSEDLQTIGGLMEANGAKWENRCSRNKAKNGISTRWRRRSCSSPPKAIDALTASPVRVEVEEKRVIDWGTITRRRRGPRSPAANFQLILGQV